MREVPAALAGPRVRGECVGVVSVTPHGMRNALEAVTLLTAVHQAHSTSKKTRFTALSGHNDTDLPANPAHGTIRCIASVYRTWW